MQSSISRRSFGRGLIAAGTATLAAPALASEVFTDGTGTTRRRISGLRTQDWRDHFPSLNNDAILCVIDDRVLHYWGEDGFYRIYPTSVPLSDELTRRGRTEVVLKRPNPSWAPTPNMRARTPGLPERIEAGDPDNPLGVRALNLSWQYYLIHGGNDIRKIGRQSSSGCIGMHNEHIVEIYDRAKVGTQVLLI